MDLSGAAVLVAGGAGQIGQAVVTALLERGTRVAVTDRLEQAQTVFADRDIRYHPGDAAEEMDCVRVVGKIIETLGSVDALINCAGVIHNEPLINLLKTDDRRHRPSSWDAVIRANLTSTFVLGSREWPSQMASTRTPGVIVKSFFLRSHRPVIRDKAPIRLPKPVSRRSRLPGRRNWACSASASSPLPPASSMLRRHT